MTKTFRIAIDVGGTFTDVVIVNDIDGSLRFAKVLSTAHDPSLGSLEGAQQCLLRNGLFANDVSEVIHATTVATNAVLERNGLVTGLITTRGFRDTLEIRRESRYDIYDFNLQLHEPLVPRKLRFEVDERLDYEGNVVVALDESKIQFIVDQLIENKVSAIAICLLHSHVNSIHERRLVELLKEMVPEIEISVSHEVSAEVREFERASTVVVDAYVKPLVRSYIERLASGLGLLGLPDKPALMLSHGGIGSALEIVNRHPVRMIESGPAAGAIAAAYFARQIMIKPDAVAFDMGGTTAKISLIQNGMPSVTHEYEVAHVHRFKKGSGIPLQISAIELLEIGAGGGSIAHLNDLGLLNVGPRSAGAMPGPACYGRGGLQPTVTDADLVLGYLDPVHFLGGEMQLNVSISRAALENNLGKKLGLSVEAVAWGIHDIVNESMTAGIRAHAAERGVDLRRFGLIAFGGAGPLHAYAIARKLGIKQVICPFGAGVASAIGCLVATPAADMVTAYAASLKFADWPLITKRFEEMASSARAMIRALIGISAVTVLRPFIEMRCEGQGYSVIVQVPEGKFGAFLEGELEQLFYQAYEEMYGHQPPKGVSLEIVNLRARIEHPRKTQDLKRPTSEASNQKQSTAIKGTRQVYFEAASGYLSTHVYDRYVLPFDVWLEGPAIVEENETSIVVGPDARFRQESLGHILIEIDIKSSLQ